MVVSRRSSVSGFKEAKEVLDRLPERVQKRVLQNAVNAGARVLQRAVKEAAPIGVEPSLASTKYGRLVDNIRTQALKRVRRTARGARVWTRDAFWGHFYELGTRFQAARPFFRPAVDSSSDAAFAAMRDRLVAGLEREAKKLAGSFATARKLLK